MAGKFILRAEQSASGFRNDRLTESAAFVVVDILVSNREAEGYVRIKVRKKMKKKRQIWGWTIRSLLEPTQATILPL